MTTGLTKVEIKTIEKWGYEFTDIPAKGQNISGVLMVINSKKHDSGYPFIRAFGVLNDGQKLVDMGWHDHYVSETATNTDALGKSVFRVSSWASYKGFTISKGFWGGSSLMLSKDGEWS